jgi:hypothetical protein
MRDVGDTNRPLLVTNSSRGTWERSNVVSAFKADDPSCPLDSMMVLKLPAEAFRRIELRRALSDGGLTPAGLIAGTLEYPSGLEIPFPLNGDLSGASCDLELSEVGHATRIRIHLSDRQTDPGLEALLIKRWLGTCNTFCRPERFDTREGAVSEHSQEESCTQLSLLDFECALARKFSPAAFQTALALGVQGDVATDWFRTVQMISMCADRRLSFATNKVMQGYVAYVAGGSALRFAFPLEIDRVHESCCELGLLRLGKREERGIYRADTTRSVVGECHARRIAPTSYDGCVESHVERRWRRGCDPV